MRGVTAIACAVAAAALVCVPGVLAAPPSNDDFANAQPITEGAVSATNAEATKEPGEPNHAGDPGGASVWFRWEAHTSELVDFRTFGSSFDTLLAVYRGSSLASLVEVASNDDWGSATASLVGFAAEAGTVYWIAVDGHGGARGSIQLERRRASRPVNDDFANATPLTDQSGSTGATTNFLATKEAQEPRHAGEAGGASVWHVWTAPRDGRVVFETCGATFDTVLAMYVGSDFATISEVSSGDDECLLGSAVEADVRGGTQYRLAVDGVGGETGYIHLRWFMSPSNDRFADAAQIDGESGSIGGSTYHATHEVGEPLHAGEAGTGSVWYRWVAPAPSRVSFSTCGSDGDTLLAVYTGSAVNSVTPVAANDDGCAAASAVEFDAAAGVAYAIAVDGFDGETSFTLQWSTSPLAPRNLVPPTISGSPVENGVLTATPGTWVHATSYSFAWYACAPGPVIRGSCERIRQPRAPGQPESQLTVPVGIIGKQIRVHVTGFGPHGNQGVYSEPTAGVGYGPPLNLTRPWLDGEARVGATLTAGEGTWNMGSAPRHGAVYLWQRCSEEGTACQNLKGPSPDNVYVVSRADIGRAIVVVVTLTTAGGSATAASFPEPVLEERTARQRRCRVPRLIGKTLGAGRRALARAACKLGRVTRTRSPRKAGLIVAQRPKPGARLAVGGRVHVVVSLGRRR